MKKPIRLHMRTSAALLSLLLLLGSCAGNGTQTVPSSGEAREEADPAENAENDIYINEVQEENAEEAAAEADEASEPAALSPEEALAIAKEYIEQPVSALIERIGEPADRDYAKSCFGDGDDGNLYYDGFIVYTYRENGEETVIDVE